MKKESQKIAIFALIALLIVGAIAYMPGVNISTMSVDTACRNYSYMGQYWDVIKGKAILQGVGEVADSEYVSSWYPNGNSEKILLTGNSHVWEGRYDWYLPPSEHPAVLIGRYWWDGYYYPANTDPNGPQRFAQHIISKNGYDHAFIQLASDSAGLFVKQQFANGNYVSTYADHALGSDGENTWWVPFNTKDYTQWYRDMQTKTTAFTVLGQRTGFIRMNLWVEFAELEVTGVAGNTLIYHSNQVLLQDDTLILKSGVGDADATSKNALSGVPGYTAEGTNDAYTRYVYKEGQIVTFHIKTGTSGQTTGQNTQDKRWKFEIFKPGSSEPITPTPVYFNDNYEGDYSFTIPMSSFIPGGDNAWKYRLTNGLIAQSEGKIFVVDVLEKMPGRTTIETDKTQYIVGNVVTVTCKANINPSTLSQIMKFDVWAKYDSSTGTSYAYGPGYVTDLQTTGQQYSGRFTFTPTKTGTVYILGHAIDKGGYAGAENSPIATVTIVPQSTTPPPTQPSQYTLTITVQSSGGAAVVGATVESSSISGTTDTNGVAIIKVPSGQQTLSVTAQGYELYQNIIIVSADIPIPVTLTPITTVPPGGDVIITVTVTTTESVPLEGATVTLGTASQKTTSTGQTAFTMASTTSATAMTVELKGYTKYNTTIYPSGNMDLPVKLIKSQGIPGFDTILVIFAIGIVMTAFIFYRKRKK